MSLIYDTEQIKKFFDEILPSSWEPHEAAFISIAARKKYLPEGYMTGLGKRPEMLDRDMIRTRDFGRYLAGLYRFTSSNGYTDRDGLPIHDWAKVFYANIHLSDSIVAYEEMKTKMAGIDREIISHTITGHNDISHAIGDIKNLHGLWFTAMQNTYSRKFWIDYDIDLLDGIDKEITAHAAFGIIDELAGCAVTKHAIITHGGVHILLATAKNGTAFSKEFNPDTILKALQNSFRETSKEVVINRNGMVPLPGTLQGGFQVHFHSR